MALPDRAGPPPHGLADKVDHLVLVTLWCPRFADNGEAV